MRPEFFKTLFDLMQKNKDIYALTGDLGFGGFDKIRDTFPDRFINTGASEQSLLDIAVGLGLSGKIPFVYTITSFYLRGIETISLYLHHESIPVLLVGSGRDDDYKHDGYSHDAGMAQDILKSMNIDQYVPQSKEIIPAMLKMMIKNKKPAFLSLKK